MYNFSYINISNIYFYMGDNVIKSMDSGGGVKMVREWVLESEGEAPIHPEDTYSPLGEFRVLM